MRKHVWRYTLLACILILVASCSSQSALEKEKANQGPPLPVQIELQPNPVHILKENQLHMIVPPDQAEVYRSAKVTVSITMPDMDHGEVTATAEFVDPGEFVATIVPTMVGDWVATISVEMDGKTITFPFTFTAQP